MHGGLPPSTCPNRRRSSHGACADRIAYYARGRLRPLLAPMPPSRTMPSRRGASQRSGRTSCQLSAVDPRGNPFYFECALEAEGAVVNSSPCSSPSPQWERRFARKGLPIVATTQGATLGVDDRSTGPANCSGSWGRRRHTYHSNNRRQYRFLTCRSVLLLSKKESDRSVQIGLPPSPRCRNTISQRERKEKQTKKKKRQRKKKDKNQKKKKKKKKKRTKTRATNRWLNKQLCFLRMEGQLFGVVR